MPGLHLKTRKNKKKIKEIPWNFNQKTSNRF